ncbi:unnamed protein product [Tuber aestivum]|uniref:C3H1-type domain-containing protein n=1 Tax=Tuber aestivum TaxID=59557 RepID=A0A292Q9Q5_9PEZI|nr:unnamed protein product [Tuber aestivum]
METKVSFLAVSLLSLLPPPPLHLSFLGASFLHLTLLFTRRVPYVPEAAFTKGPPRHNSHAAAATHRPSPARNGINRASPPAPTGGTVPPLVADHAIPNTSAPAAVPVLQVSNPHQQLHNDTPRIIRPRPVKWTKRCQYDLSTGCHRGIKCFFGHLGDVYTDSPTVLQEFTSNGFNTRTLRRAELERVGESLNLDQALRAVVPRSQRHPKHNTGASKRGANTTSNCRQSSRDLLIAGAINVNTHFTPPEHMWDGETLHAGASPAHPAGYEGVQPFESSASPEVTLVQRPNSQERSQYHSAPDYNCHGYDGGAPYHACLVYGLAVGMAPFFGASTSPLDSPGNLFRVNATGELYYYGVDGVMYQYNPAFWAAQNRQYHMTQQANNYTVVGGPTPQQFSGPALDPGYQHLQSWINDLPTPTPVPEGYTCNHAQNAGAWPPAHQQHDYSLPISQQGYGSHAPSPCGGMQQEPPAYAGVFHQHTSPTEEVAQQLYEETFPKLAPKNETNCQRPSTSK